MRKVDFTHSSVLCQKLYISLEHNHEETKGGDDDDYLSFLKQRSGGNKELEEYQNNKDNYK